jgi:hypothetical protein
MYEEIQRLLKEKINMDVGKEPKWLAGTNCLEVLGDKYRIYAFIDKMTEVYKSYITLPKEMFFVEDSGRLWLKVTDASDMEWKIRQWG